jgi:DNA-binding beta-propeller fold protein YncE
MPVIGMRTRLVLLASAVMLAQGCASPAPRFNLFPGQGAGAQQTVWPAPPETARYRYGGELLGQVNFEAAARESAGSRMLAWIVGVDHEREREATLKRPQCGMVDVAGRILVTDLGQQAVAVFDAKSGLSFWDRADRGVHFAGPLGITAGPDAEIYVADAELARVVRLDARGNPLGSFGDGLLKRPTGLVRDPVTRLTYVADTTAHDIKVFDDSHTLVRTLGGRGTEPGRFNAPTFLALHEGGIVVSDTLNARVQLISATGDPRSVIGQRGIYVGNLTRPKGVAVDGDGNIYVVESFYDHLLVFDRSGQLLLPIGGGGSDPGKFFLPGGAWSDGANRIFVADVFNARVSIFQYLEAPR